MKFKKFITAIIVGLSVLAYSTEDIKAMKNYEEVNMIDILKTKQYEELALVPVNVSVKKADKVNNSIIKEAKRREEELKRKEELRKQELKRQKELEEQQIKKSHNNISKPKYVEPQVKKASTKEPVKPTGNMSAKEAFERICAEKGVTGADKSFWASIISRESGWNTTISNPDSGAYGLPQALPGSKMASAGADWRTNPYTQLKWMYNYMNDRYGSIAGARAFWDKNHWY